MNEEMKALFEEVKGQIEQLKKRGASEDEISKWNSLVENAATKEDLQNMESVLKDQGEALQKILDEMATSNASAKSQNEVIAKFIKDNYDAIKKIKADNHGVVSLDVNKVVGDISTASGSIAVAGRALGTVTPANLRDADFFQYIDVAPTSMAQFSYTDMLPKEGSALAVAEGTAKPEIDFTWEQRYPKLTKVAAWEKLTEEAAKDVDGLIYSANEFLRKKVNIGVEADVLFGDGTGAKSYGVTSIARSFVAGGMALKVANPTLIDAINAAKVDIMTTHNYTDEAPYMANIALVNPVDFFLNFVAVKDANGVAIYPNASVDMAVSIGGTRIVPSERIPSGKMLVGDLSKFNLRVRDGYNVRIGYVNDDFIKNQFVILGEVRYFAYAKELDKAAFIYDDVATIITAITKP